MPTGSGPLWRATASRSSSERRKMRASSSRVRMRAAQLPVPVVPFGGRRAGIEAAVEGARVGTDGKAQSGLGRLRSS